MVSQLVWSLPYMIRTPNFRCRARFTICSPEPDIDGRYRSRRTEMCLQLCVVLAFHQTKCHACKILFVIRNIVIISTQIKRDAISFCVSASTKPGDRDISDANIQEWLLPVWEHHPRVRQSAWGVHSDLFALSTSTGNCFIYSMTQTRHIMTINLANGHVSPIPASDRSTDDNDESLLSTPHANGTAAPIAICFTTWRPGGHGQKNPFQQALVVVDKKATLRVFKLQQPNQARQDPFAQMSAAINLANGKPHAHVTAFRLCPVC